ncbi:hypothetical protein A2713_00040 [candidate division WWE3 bacterium RIFCSPHIGHO2_01_FULL_35_17]|uniref:DUF4365 domain-containing protein n=1 Tax=candidate division WWE3 bacterium RIFCSPHIGHO2_01_FULL_35_17 TaxID=1802614 RepID=A0A1F4UQ04_UNCKA|nr:MAG: hypothetical protein A2713_00040 [candidate division WWE3 bacterium RIFCSPHIGHO2_01_FULL_35_17]
MSLFLKSKQKGNKGEALVESALSEYAIVHRVNGSNDIGLDMLCEWVTGEKPTQLMFGIQVKTLKKNLKDLQHKSELNWLPEYKGTVSINKKTLNYWRGLDFPVFVFFVDLEKSRIYYKRYTSILHDLKSHIEEPFYLVAENNQFKAYVQGKTHTWGFCRDLFFDHLRCQHNKGNLSGVDPNKLGLKGWSNEVLYKGVFDQYQDKIATTFNRYKRLEHLFRTKSES